ncbi:shikimate kinase [Nocardioides terrae]|uniref:Shikimate kinase n=1 Tax=Nocardioides terrae TaxID=574651 RepID=A0A1I1LYY7_9ACTN|nr:shikimate kinase [Nocardioides terrae]SFC78195.1 shikimate kinase [Nocardioides terrae]
MAEQTRPRVVLVGPMGSGKSTVGRVLAQRWGVDVRDSDADVEQTAGKPVPEVFVDDGEARFRELEKAAVALALRTHDGVLSLGGGAVLDPDTQVLLEGHRVVFLRVGLADAVKRVGIGAGRPLLLGGDGGIRARVRSLLEERNPVYEGVATVVVDTDGRTPEQVADDVENGLEEGLR